MLFTKCILHKPVPEDGVRISVMSRHTLNDGITPDDQIQNFDYHYPLLGPSGKLIGLYYRKRINWTQFAMIYVYQLRESKKVEALKALTYMALTQNVTIMCIEETTEFCHRRLLAEECQRLEPGLIVEHR